MGFIFFVVVQLLSRVPLSVTPWTAAHQAPLSSAGSWSFLNFMSIELVMPSTISLSQHEGLFQGLSFLHQVAKVLEFQLQHQSFQ